MKVLVDTHVSIWAVDNPSQLSPAATVAIQDTANELLFSAGSIWEISIKVGLDRLKLTHPFREWMEKAIADLGLIILPVTVVYADLLCSLPKIHGDPFDRLLIAQSIVENVPVISHDSVLDRYGVSRIW